MSASLRAPPLATSAPGSVRDPYAEVLSTPYPDAGPIVRHLDDSVDDASPTTAMERERESARELPYPQARLQHASVGREPIQQGIRTRADFGAVNRESPRPSTSLRSRANHVAPSPPPAIPHFREQDPNAIAAPNSAPRVSSGAPYVVWLVASALAGIISYHVAPEILTRFEAPRQDVRADTTSNGQLPNQ